MAKTISSITLFLTLLTIVLGAATRVWDAGMSCPDWPTCYGVWNPFHPTAVPEGGYVVDGITYTVFQVALEWGHRLCAMLVGFGLLGLLVLAPRTGKHTWWPLGLALVLLAVQVKLGAVTVWLNNINWSVALHLGNAMLVLGAVAWYGRALRAGEGPYQPPMVKGVAKGLVMMAPVLVLCTMVVGAFVSSSHAGGVCGGLWACDGAWLPADTNQLWHMKHRYLALLVVVLTVALVVACKPVGGVVGKAAKAFAAMVCVQVFLGILTLYSFAHYAHMYEWLSVGHLAFGTVLYLVSVGMVLNLRYGTAGRAHG